MKSKKTGSHLEHGEEHRLEHRIALIFLIALGAVVPAFGSDVSVEMSADRATLGQDDELQLEVVVKEVKNDNQPAIAGIENFESQGVSTSSQVSDYQREHDPPEGLYIHPGSEEVPGCFALGPHGWFPTGRPTRAKRISIQVMKVSPKEASQTKNFELTADVDNKSPFVNEQIAYTFRFLKRARDRGASANFPTSRAFGEKSWRSRRNTKKSSAARGGISRRLNLRFFRFLRAP